MTQVWNFLKGKKTYITAGIAVGLYMLQQAGIQVPGVTVDGHAVELAVLAATIRHGVATDAAKAAIILLALGLGAAFMDGGTTLALAADMPVKARPLPQVSNAYPTSTCGLYYGLAAEGGSGVVNGAPAGTVQIGGDVGGLIGYACPVAGIPWFAQFKAEFQNLNAGNAGFSLKGPAHFEELVAVQTPLISWISGYLNVGQNNIPAIVQLLPPGVSAAGAPQNYVGLAITQDDISANYGATTNKDWLNSFGIRTGLLYNLTGPNGTKAVGDVFAEINFQSTPLGCLSLGGGNVGCPKLGDRFLAGIELKM